MRLFFAVCCVLMGSWLVGCASSTTSLQNARALDPGEVQVTMAMSLPIPTAAIGAAYDEAKSVGKELGSAAASGEDISLEQQRQITTGGLLFALFQPGFIGEINGRVGIRENLDLGLRYSSQQVKGDVKYQLLEQEELGFDGAISLGYGHHLDIGPSIAASTFSFLEYISLGDYSRTDLDLTAIASKDWGESLSVYGSLRYIVSFIELDSTLEKVESVSGVQKSDLSNRMHQYGATVGTMVGYKYLFLHLELTILNTHYMPTILGEQRDLGGLVIGPTLGLTGRY